jgi:UPF0271 protein
MKKQKYLIDSSAILSGIPLVFSDGDMITTPEIAHEFSPGGRDYRTFTLLQEKGLLIMQASKKSTQQLIKIVEKIGEHKRLSPADISLLALAYELNQDPTNKIQIITDDYGIQNIAAHLNINYKEISQRGITKKFKWTTRCPGCGKHFTDNPPICPICGTKTQFSSQQIGSISKS